VRWWLSTRTCAARFVSHVPSTLQWGKAGASRRGSVLVPIGSPATAPAILALTEQIETTIGMEFVLQRRMAVLVLMTAKLYR